MFDYQVSKHPHFDEACRAFALRHNLVQLAERAGMNVQILRNKLNPAQPHLLTAPEIWLLTDLTEDSTLVDGFLAQISHIRQRFYLRRFFYLILFHSYLSPFRERCALCCGVSF